MRRLIPITSIILFVFLAGPINALAGWEARTVLLPTGGKEGELRGVSCASATVCTAVGHYWNGSIWGALGNEWNSGSGTWPAASVIANPGDKNGNLWDISCYSTTRCTATGAYGNKGTGLPLAEASNKGVWKQQSPPSLGSTPELKGVDCLSIEYCLATGDHFAGFPSVLGAIAAEWEGAVWNPMSPIENPGGQKNGKLWSVDCSAEASCRAVGGWGTTEGIGVGGSETWDGKEWKSTLLAPAGAKFSELFDISCPEASSCLAVGSWRNVAETTASYAEYWNGSKWTYSETVIPSGAIESELKSVSCPEVEKCIAVGHYTTNSFVQKTLAEIWNGKEWQIQATPNPGSVLSDFRGISCVAIEDCMAVGYAVIGGVKVPIAAQL